MAGVQFPKSEKGDRSTTAFNKNAFSALAEACGSQDLAEGVRREKDWRFGYVKHLVSITAAQVQADPETTLKSFEAGLAKARALEFESSEGVTTSLDEAMANGKNAFDTAVIQGAAEQMPGFVVPDAYGHAELQGKALDAQIQAWAKYGVMEPDCAQAVIDGVAQLSSKPKPLAGRTFVVIGAGSELGPLKYLLQAGATVAALATRKAGRWEALIEFAKNTPGVLLLPVAQGAGGIHGPAADFKAVAQAAGVDLLTEAPAVAAWVRSVVSGAPGPVTVGTYLYMDGEANVRVTAVSDFIVEDVARAFGPSKVNFAWLGSPATVYTIPMDCKKAQEDHLANEASWWLKLFAGKTEISTVHRSDGKEVVLINGLAQLQGPNYALAQFVRQWRAMLLNSQGFSVSKPMTPICRTDSVIGKNKAIAAALNGMYAVKPMEAFHPETASAIMFAILVSDLHEAIVPKLASPYELFERKSFHSGVWRCPFSVEGAAKILAVVGTVWGKDCPR